MNELDIAHEEEAWGRIFESELKKEKFVDFSDEWWRYYYAQITAHILNLLSPYPVPKILEAGSGSGKASILVGKHKGEITLLDISTNALEFAKYLAGKFSLDGVRFLQGNIFQLPFEDSTYDLTWNIGTLEHYGEQRIIDAVNEMGRVTKDGGRVAFGIPNFYSGPTLKAWLLSKKMFHWIPGYRLDTETFMPASKWVELARKAGNNQWECDNLNIDYFGHFLPMETPKFILDCTRWLDRILKRNRFLIFISFTVKKKTGQ